MIPDASAYLVNLEALARELASQAHASLAIGALRLLRERLKQWVEDLRSVGGHEALADTVADQVQRLSHALASGTDLTAAVQAVAEALTNIAAGGPLPPREPSRGAFWK